MIFVILGTQKFQFNRLLKKIDELIEKKVIKEDVFAQIGNSTYNPKNFQYKKFLTREEFKEKIEISNLIITHGGTGAIITSLKEEKKVIAIPRLVRYGEHVDDHQIQIVEEFSNSEMIEVCINIEELEDKISKIKDKKFEKYISNTNVLISDIEEFIKKCL